MNDNSKKEKAPKQSDLSIPQTASAADPTDAVQPAPQGVDWEAEVDKAFDELLQIYLASRHRKKVDIITKAFNFARQAHRGVQRLSGEPYIMHPIAVARIAAEEIGLGSTSICSALLHDVVEDTDYTTEDIENLIGKKIAQIVDGLTKISGGIFGEHSSAQAENFKKLLLTMNDDIRVILIKICDRLHNMRTLASQPNNKKMKIAGETLYIYAPIANRLGLNKIKNELEDLSFKFEYPDTYDFIQRKLAKTKAQRETLFNNFTQPIRQILDKKGLRYEIKARIKSPYSIWSKMKSKNLTFDEIYDILAVRIIFEPSSPEREASDCFDIYVALCKLYTSHPDRFRDWVTKPKANGYMALHVTLMSKTGQWVEVQIRSERMDEIAEQGFAAHWKYKDNGNYNDTIVLSEEETELEDWLRTIQEILDDPQPDAMDFLDSIKLNLFSSEIIVFTPKGEIKTMPVDSTALDFAFNIHTFLGSHCIGAKVNHKLVPISHRLNSGDQVEILTSNSQHVSESWLQFATTAKAITKIQAILRRDNRELQKQGEQVLSEWLKANDIEASMSVLDKLCEIHDKKKHEDLYLALGKKTIELGDKDIEQVLKKKTSSSSGGWRRYVPFLRSDNTPDKPMPQTSGLYVVGDGFNKKKPVYISEDNISQYVFPKCCHPIPGDDTLGYIDNKKHIEIHNRTCPVAAKLKTSFGNRILDAQWNMHDQLFFDATIRLRGIDRKGMLLDVSEVLSGHLSLNIHHITISSENGIFDGTVDVKVHDRKQVQHVIDQLKKIKDLQEVSQIL
ncbi:MAG: bifunctional (p)ppGpp synthetase/guanosine-3',5'-bis(diphosphate) 3'-pyrophosphohydrolase [Prevotella sp.]|nr:bifunctional (p)ppGpp synthetase/guanosine-3',5'-bis(diphosphate) 3'-pyrophosphohydrolase [Prevotella sp.]